MLNESDTELSKGREIDIQASIDQYFFSELPIRMAQNLAKMHNAGIVHEFLHSGNVSAIGGIYDLDSVEGIPLDLKDEPIQEYVREERTNNDRGTVMRDLRFILNTNHSVLESLKQMQNKGFISSGADLLQRFKRKFLEAYFSLRWEKSWLAKVDAVLLFNRVNDVLAGDVAMLRYVNNLFTRLLLPTTNRTGYDFRSDLNPEELINPFLISQLLSLEKGIQVAIDREEDHEFILEYINMYLDPNHMRERLYVYLHGRIYDEFKQQVTKPADKSLSGFVGLLFMKREHVRLVLKALERFGDSLIEVLRPGVEREREKYLLKRVANDANSDKTS